MIYVQNYKKFNENNYKRKKNRKNIVHFALFCHFLLPKQKNVVSLHYNLIEAVMAKDVNSNFDVILYNRIRPDDKIVREVEHNRMSSTYILQSGKDLRMLADERTYQFLKGKMMSHKFKHVATIADCFEVKIISEDYEDNIYCVVSEPLNRDYISEETKQAGINLFRDTWMEYLHCSVSDAFGRIDEAYFSKDSKEKFVLQSIEDSRRNPEEIKVAIALHNAFRDVISLGPAMIWPYPINVGLSDDGVVKITHIGIR